LGHQTEGRQESPAERIKIRVPVVRIATKALKIIDFNEEYLAKDMIKTRAVGLV